MQTIFVRDNDNTPHIPPMSLGHALLTPSQIETAGWRRVVSLPTPISAVDARQTMLAHEKSALANFYYSQLYG